MGISVHGNYNKCAWIGMARMETASDLKTSGRIFQVSALASQIKSLKPDFQLACFCFENSFDIVPFRWSKSNSCVNKVLWYKLIKIVTKKIGKSPWDWPFNWCCKRALRVCNLSCRIYEPTTWSSLFLYLFPESLNDMKHCHRTMVMSLCQS